MNIVILGATGILGEQALSLVDRYQERFQVTGMSAQKNAEKLSELVDLFEADRFYLSNFETGDERQVERPEGLITPDTDHVMVLDHGMGCLPAILKAIAMKKTVSIANKELLIAHGQDILYLARETGALVIPLDSEHNAIFQCLQGEKSSAVKKLIITASGGPFLRKDSLQNITIDDVLRHPTWKMGKKTTVDCATLVNKAYEVIEAHCLFQIPYERIEVRIHPESLVHAIVEFQDGSCKMLAYTPDMKIPLAYALFYPERAPEIMSEVPSFPFDRNLHFETIQAGQFPCFDFILNTAQDRPSELLRILQNDQHAVDAYLSGQIAFHEIYEVLKKGL